MQKKTCAKCCEPKDIGEFGFRKTSKDGRRAECRKCQSEYQVEWQRKNRDKFNSYQRTFRARHGEKVREWDKRYHAKWRELKPERYQANYHKAKCKKYGVSVEWYQEQFAKQNGVCAICLQPCKSGRKLAIDHSHATGKARGLLCSDCNTALARVEDNEQWVVRAGDYLRLYE